MRYKISLAHSIILNFLANFTGPRQESAARKSPYIFDHDVCTIEFFNCRRLLEAGQPQLIYLLLLHVVLTVVKPRDPDANQPEESPRFHFDFQEGHCCTCYIFRGFHGFCHGPLSGERGEIREAQLDLYSATPQGLFLQTQSL